MENQKLVGTVVFLKINEGSKSEAIVPFLYQGKDSSPQRIMLREDNPFENNGLTAYDGKAVELAGAIAPSGTFLAETITAL